MKLDVATLHFGKSATGNIIVPGLADRAMRIAFINIFVSGVTTGESLLVSYGQGQANSPFLNFAGPVMDATTTSVCLSIGLTQATQSGGGELTMNGPVPDLWHRYDVQVIIASSIGATVTGVTVGYQLMPE